MHAALVGLGILLSRILGLVRESLKARYLGTGLAADAFTAAFRIPNMLNNLFGEGALSASFIPVYSNLLARGDSREADRVAGAVGALLALVTAVLVLLGVLFAPAIVYVVAAGFEGERRELTIQLTRILFPGAALFVMSAWCLGVLNSHRRFLLSYAAPVVWNAALIAALVIYRDAAAPHIANRLAWASVVGALLQFIVQLPVVVRVAPHVRANLGRGNDAVRRVLRNFTPAFFARGVVQISNYIDQFIASFLGVGPVSLLFYAQTIAILPVSLFGMAVSASELPEMSSATGTTQQVADHIRGRLSSGLRRVAFLVIPSAAAFAVLGDVIVAALFQSGRFTAADTRFTWAILAAAAVGLLATTLGRLYSSAYYALGDAQTPLRFAIVRVVLASIIGYFAALHVPQLLGINREWGAALLTLSSGIVGWIEFILLRRGINARVGRSAPAARLLVTLWGAALVAAGAAYYSRRLVDDAHRFVVAIVVLGTFGALYLGITTALGVPEVRDLVRRVTRRAGKNEGKGAG